MFQYVAPMILILYLSLLYKTLGGGTWTGESASLPVNQEECSLHAAGSQVNIYQGCGPGDFSTDPDTVQAFETYRSGSNL